MESRRPLCRLWSRSPRDAHGSRFRQVPVPATCEERLGLGFSNLSSFDQTSLSPKLYMILLDGEFRIEA